MDHIDRVLKNAYKIAADFSCVNLEVLTIATLLHDADQPSGQKNEHVELSLKCASKILDDVGISEELKNKILTIISEHSTETTNDINPSSIESKILFDADKIDGLGATGIARVFSLFGQIGKNPFEVIPWYRSKIKVSLENMQTEAGKLIFQDRLSFVEDFLNKLENENSSLAQVGVKPS